MAIHAYGRLHEYYLVYDTRSRPLSTTRSKAIIQCRMLTPCVLDLIPKARSTSDGLFIETSLIYHIDYAMLPDLHQITTTSTQHFAPPSIRFIPRGHVFRSPSLNRRALLPGRVVLITTGMVLYRRSVPAEEL